MASSDQIKNMELYLRGATSERLRNLDKDIAQVKYDLDDAWATRFEEPKEQVETASYDDEDCQLRKRKTKNIGKGYTRGHCNRKLLRDFHSKKRAKEARSRKRTKRSHTQAKGERDHGLNLFNTVDIEEREQEEQEQKWPVCDEEADWMEEMHREILALVEWW